MAVILVHSVLIILAHTNNWYGMHQNNSHLLMHMTMDKASGKVYLMQMKLPEKSSRYFLLTRWPPSCLTLTPLYIKIPDVIPLWWFILKGTEIHGRILRREMTFKVELVKDGTSHLSEKNGFERAKVSPERQWRGEKWRTHESWVVEISRGKLMN